MNFSKLVISLFMTLSISAHSMEVKEHIGYLQLGGGKLKVMMNQYTEKIKAYERPRTKSVPIAIPNIVSNEAKELSWENNDNGWLKVDHDEEQDQQEDEEEVELVLIPLLASQKELDSSLTLKIQQGLKTSYDIYNHEDASTKYRIFDGSDWGHQENPLLILLEYRFYRSAFYLHQLGVALTTEEDINSARPSDGELELDLSDLSDAGLVKITSKICLYYFETYLKQEAPKIKMKAEFNREEQSFATFFGNAMRFLKP